jgi:hypothetical protein
MPLVRIDRDYVLDRVYECRGKIDYTNHEALEKLTEIINLIVMAPLAESQANLPKIKISR